MVQIRDSLPLLDGNAGVDSAALTASLAAGIDIHQDIIHPDFKKQLATHKPDSALDRSSEYSIRESDIDIKAWLDAVSLRIGQEDVPLLKKACQFVQTHTTTTNHIRSGAFATGVGMADILAYLFQDEAALVAAMLYRAARHKLVDMTDIHKEFGADVASLVADTLAMGHLSESIEQNKRLEDYFNNNEREHLSNIYSMLISTTNDVRAVLIKLAERTFAMRELSFAEDRQKRVAKEVMTIYAPLAHRLGIAQLKWELEDLAFRYLEPDEYKRIAKLLAEKRSEREAYILLVQDKLKEALKAAAIDGEISRARQAHLFHLAQNETQKPFF